MLCGKLLSSHFLIIIHSEDFSKPKIVWGNLNLKSSYALVKDNIFVNAPSPMIIPGSKYLLALLNSRLGDYYIRSLGVTRNGGYFEYKPMFVERLPIPINVNDEVKKNIETLVDESNEEEIDSLVYSIYGLSHAEIDYINNLT